MMIRETKQKISEKVNCSVRCGPAVQMDFRRIERHNRMIKAVGMRKERRLEWNEAQLFVCL
jgi:hypothetical protein